MHSTLDPNHIHFAVDLLILTVREGRLNLLLSRRTAPPYQNLWALPGRLVALDESAEDAAERLMAEMLPVGEAYYEQLYTFSAPNRDPRGRVVSAAYLVIVPWRRLAVALEGEDVQLRPFEVRLEKDAAAFIGPDGARLNGAALAFDHDRVIATGIRRLQGKLDYTEIGFHFLDDARSFSLNALMAIYTAILGRDRDFSNFRRMIRSRYESTGRIAPTGKLEKGDHGRPAALYTLIDDR